MTSTSTNPAVTLSGLTIRYGALVAAEAVSLSVPVGCVYTLLGRNGAGKTSLFRCMLGQQKPTSGSAALFGEDVWRRRAALMARVGVVPEEPDLPPEMTADQLIAFFSRLYRPWDGRSALERLSRFAIPTRTPVGRLSKGQKGQLALALALAPHPELLVLDDPTLGLDVVARRALWQELVGDLADRGTSVFLTTHDLTGVEGIAERVGILKGGRLIVDEPLEQLKTRFRRIRFGRPSDAENGGDDPLADLQAISLIDREWGREAVVTAFDDQRFVAFRSLPGVLDAQAEPMSLEDIFAALVGDEKEVAS
jgi:ABC-2 type transport system ATP-binding protein